MKRGRIVEVEWNDHSFARAAEDAGIARQRSVGYLVKRTKKALVLAQSWGENGPEEVLTIGRVMIRKERRR